jgi:hypothetical protein
MRIVPKRCKLCGNRYDYMGSAYGQSPEEYNKSKGVTRHCCMKCAPRTTPLHIRLWDLREEITGWADRIEFMMRSPDKWMGAHRFRDTLGKAAREVKKPESIKSGPVSVQPMSRPSGRVFYDFKVNR